MTKSIVRSWLANTLLFGGSLILAMVLAEFCVRIVLHPVDYLLPTIVSDEHLVHRVEGGSGGHDEWGFRNHTTPSTADMVAIGDSMTYGVAAHSDESWPSRLQALTGKSVYNMSLGGYGPLHYLYLMRERALQLEPRQIIVGLYLGNDLLDAFNLAYAKDEWARFRSSDLDDTGEHVSFMIQQEEAESEGKLFGKARRYLAGMSVLYRLTTSLPLFDRYRGVNTGSTDPRLYVFQRESETTILTPTQNRLLMDAQSPQIAAALEMTERALAEMKIIALEHDIKLYVLLVPTKELVYADLLAERRKTDEHPDMATALTAERTAREGLLEFLDSADIESIDPLPEMRDGVLKNEIYPFNDGHPNASGYEIIARKIADVIGT